MAAPKGNQFAKDCTTNGRRSGYKKEFAKQAKKLCELGATDFEIASFFGVHTATVYRWRIQYKDFCDALIAGKEKADARVERAFFSRAVGYTFESEKIFQNAGAVVRAEILEHVPPDPGAALSWLKNRQPDKWRDKQTHEHGGANGGPIEIKDVSDSDRAAALMAFLAKTKKG